MSTALLHRPRSPGDVNTACGRYPVCVSMSVLCHTDDYYNRFQGYFQSDEYYSDLNYTRTLGGTYSTARSAYDNDTPLFWVGARSVENT